MGQTYRIFCVWFFSDWLAQLLLHFGEITDGEFDVVEAVGHFHVDNALLAFQFDLLPVFLVKHDVSVGGVDTCDDSGIVDD